MDVQERIRTSPGTVQIRTAQEHILQGFAVYVLDEPGEEFERIHLSSSRRVRDVGELIPLPSRTVFTLVAGKPHALNVDSGPFGLLLHADLWSLTRLRKFI